MKDSHHESTINTLCARAQELIASIKSIHEADIYNAKAASELHEELSFTITQMKAIAAQRNTK